MVDCENLGNVQVKSESFEIQGGENIEVKASKNALAKELRVLPNSTRDSGKTKTSGKKSPGKFKGKGQYFFGFLVWLCLFFTVTYFFGDLSEEYLRRQFIVIPEIKSKSPECTDFLSVVCQNKTLTTFDDLKISHSWKITELLSMDDTPVNSQNQYKNPEDAKEKARNFFRSCLVACQSQKSQNNFLAENADAEKLAESPDFVFAIKLMKNLTKFSNLEAKLEYLHNELGFSTFFRWNIAPDLKASNTNVLQILPELHTKDEITPEELLATSQGAAKLFGRMFSLYWDETDKEGQLKSLVEMELSLWTALSHVSDTANPLTLYKALTLAQLQEQVDMINWQNFFNDALGRADSGKSKVVDLNAKIVVWNLAQLQNFTQSLSKVRTEHSKKTFNSLLDKFLTWQVMTSTLKPFQSTDSCPDVCKEETVRHFEFAVAALLLEKSPSFSPPGSWPAIFSAVRKMAENIRAELIQMLEKSPWHEGIGDNPGDSRQIARALVEKVKATRIKIGYPEFINDPQQLNDHYAAIGNMDESDYFENLKNILVAKRVENSKLFGKSVDKSRWRTGEENGGLTAVSAGAVNFRDFNEIILPIGILVSPVFHLNSSLTQKYGSLGAIIGHEFFHGLAFLGLDFNEDGRFQNRTVRLPKKLSDCLVKQYSKFQYDDGSTLNGTRTLDENLCDNVGLRIALRAFLHQLERQRTALGVNGQSSQDLHRQNMKELQMFFRSFAGNWCGEGYKAASFMARDDPHSPGKFRVLGALQNTPEFAQAFSCSQQQYMFLGCQTF